jgi:hypothetical protein
LGARALILRGDMGFLARFSPLRAFSDLRAFLAQRKPYELWFLLLALLVTVGIWFGFLKDSQFEKPYERNIIYVESWPITRSDKEIIDRQKAEQVQKRIQQAELEKKQKARQAEFKKIDDSLKSIGL